jgi:hypothetical protein
MNRYTFEKYVCNPWFPKKDLEFHNNPPDPHYIYELLCMAPKLFEKQFATHNLFPKKYLKLQYNPTCKP